MARKLTSEETRLVDEMTGPIPKEISDFQMILDLLSRRRDTAMEMSAELGVWFGDKFPLPPGF